MEVSVSRSTKKKKIFAINRCCSYFFFTYISRRNKEIIEEKGGNSVVYIVSRAQSKDKRRVCHRQGCPYEKRIDFHNKMMLKVTQAEQMGYGSCSYCSGLKGDVSVNTAKLDAWKRSNTIDFYYRPETNELFIWTDIGFWKVSENRYEAYLLWHRNTYNKDIPFEKARRGQFHRQSDLGATYSLDKIIDYILAHDRAKAIMRVDYRQLPQSTKKQKMYYKKAEKKQKIKDCKRVEYLFKILESQNRALG